MAIFVLPYKNGSQSASSLASALGCKRMKLEGSTVKNSKSNLIINWGNSTTDISHLDSVAIMNPQEVLATATHKLKFFNKIAEANHENGEDDQIHIPEFSTDKADAEAWLSEGRDVVCRHRLQGHSGEGIELIKAPAEGESAPSIPDAPLYTAYVKKRDEYRIHVIKGVVTDVQRKARNRSVDSDEVCYQIRNHSNGFIYMREGVEPDQQILDQATKAVREVGLDFGAVDIIWNNNQQKAYVLEVNTACGLEGTTLDRYKGAFKCIIDGKEDEIKTWDHVEETQEEAPEEGIDARIRRSINLSSGIGSDTSMRFDPSATTMARPSPRMYATTASGDWVAHMDGVRPSEETEESPTEQGDRFRTYDGEEVVVGGQYRLVDGHGGRTNLWAESGQLIEVDNVYPEEEDRLNVRIRAVNPIDDRDRDMIQHVPASSLTAVGQADINVGENYRVIQGNGGHTDRWFEEGATVQVVSRRPTGAFMTRRVDRDEGSRTQVFQAHHLGSVTEPVPAPAAVRAAERANNGLAIGTIGTLQQGRFIATPRRWADQRIPVEIVRRDGPNVIQVRAIGSETTAWVSADGFNPL